MRVLSLVIYQIILFISFSAFGQRTSLAFKVGDKAPPLTVIKWLKGEPVTEFKKGQLYVVEFSGTWCGPCRKAIPHLTELSRKYAGKIPIISVYWENNNKEDTTDLRYVKKVSDLVETMGDKMDFAIAIDVPQHTTKEAWKVGPFPTIHVIDESGNISWIGTDPNELDAVLEQISKGDFNAELAKLQQVQFDDYLKSIWHQGIVIDTARALPGIDSLIHLYPEITGLYTIKFDILLRKNVNKAYSWLQYLLESKKSIEWGSIIGYSLHKIPPDKRNYKLDLAACDKGIEESVSKYYSTWFFWQKAEIYDAMGEFKKAIEMCQKAVEYSSSGQTPNPDNELFEEYSVGYQYKFRKSKNQAKARRWLQEEVSNGKVKSGVYLLGAVLHSNQPDYDLALWLQNKRILDCTNIQDLAAHLAELSNLYIKIGKFNKAIMLLQEALAIKEKYAPEHKASIDRYKKKIEELKN